MNKKGTIEGVASLSGVITAISPIDGEVSNQNSTSLNGSVSTYPKKTVDYTGEYEVVPKAHEDQTLETQGKLMSKDVLVFKVAKYETSNLSGGYTVYIAEE